MDVKQRATELARRIEYHGVEIEEAVEVAAADLKRITAYPIGAVKEAAGDVANFGSGLRRRLNLI